MTFDTKAEVTIEMLMELNKFKMLKKQIFSLKLFVKTLIYEPKEQFNKTV